MNRVYPSQCVVDAAVVATTSVPDIRASVRDVRPFKSSHDALRPLAPGRRHRPPERGRHIYYSAR